jgi:nitrogen-specific signal transduction histidine kinase
MKPFSNFRDIKYLLIVVAAIIAAASLFVSNNFVEKLKLEEKNKMQVWASAMSSIINAELNEDVTLEQNILSSNKTIPVVLTDDTGSIIQENNIKIPANADSLTVLMERVADMRKKGNVIPIYMDGVGEQYVCYDDSNILILLSYYPYIQLCVVLIFLIICVVAVVSSKRAEQNRVWVGLSKETAHQLGTPISSLMAWVEVLKEKYPDDELLPDMSHDVERLQRVAERFSKIGSKPEHSLDDIVAVVEKSIEYVKRRSPSKVEYVVNFPKRPLTVRMNTPLIEWVIENLCKNAVDAMEGNGVITVTVSHDERNAYIDVADTGKGISKSNRKMVFEPGYTTKKRGWGLGLSLAKRIMEEYHDGKIFVKKSAPGKGTTFRMELKK